MEKEATRREKRRKIQCYKAKNLTEVTFIISEAALEATKKIVVRTENIGAGATSKSCSLISPLKEANCI
jgi:hypothetical protein